MILNLLKAQGLGLLSLVIMCAVIKAQNIPEYEDIRLEMGQRDDVEPPDFSSNPFPTDNDPFSRVQQFDSFDTFRTSTTPDPFRGVLRSTTEVNFNQFQNNELGNARQPLDPILRSYERNRPAPQVDEFGNPLGKYEGTIIQVQLQAMEQTQLDSKT